MLRRKLLASLLAGKLALVNSACTLTTAISNPDQLNKDIYDNYHPALHYSGRMSLVFDQKPEGLQGQSFSGRFELNGSLRAGQLDLATPLGNVLAQLSWRDGFAQLKSSQQTQEYASLDQMFQEALGISIEASLLFDWLRGRPNLKQSKEWLVDLSQRQSGRISARYTPSSDSKLPPASLRIILEQL